MLRGGLEGVEIAEMAETLRVSESEHVALELQNTAGGQVSFGRTRSTGDAGHYNVVYQYAQREVGREAGELAFRLLNGLLPEELRSADQSLGSSTSTNDRERIEVRGLDPEESQLHFATAEHNAVSWVETLLRRSTLKFSAMVTTSG